MTWHLSVHERDKRFYITAQELSVLPQESGIAYEPEATKSPAQHVRKYGQREMTSLIIIIRYATMDMQSINEILNDFKLMTPEPPTNMDPIEKLTP